MKKNPGAAAKDTMGSYKKLKRNLLILHYFWQFLSD
jgi:hypothetical protein